jgi:TonB-linked SusC/RagA family outer membrane protein
MSINGGTDNNNYYASLSYYNQGSLYTQNTNNLDIYTARLNVTNSFEKIGLKTTTGISGTFWEYNSPYYDYYSIWGHIQNKSPMEAAYNDLGLYSSHTDHPLVEMDSRSGYNNRDRKNINGLFKAEWQVPYVQGLKLTSLSNYYMSFYKQKSWKDMAPQYALGSTTPISKNPPRLDTEYAQGYTFTQQFLADYDRKINDFTLGVLAGYEFTKGFDSNLKASRENYQLDMDQIQAGPTDNMKNDGTEAEFARTGYLGRLKIDYKAKYLLEASFRYDGSDWFPEGNRWGTFYAFSGGWIVSDETFMEGLKDKNILNMFKLRGSYGIVGLDGDLTKGLSDDNPFKLKRFSYVPGYNLDGRAYVINNNYVQGFREGDLVSTDITWYTTASTDIGFDFESSGNKLFGGFNYFYTRTTGYLTSPSNVGYTAPLGVSLPRVRSDGAQRKEGFEVNLGYRNNINELQYEVSANYSYYNKLWENNPLESESNLKNPYMRDTHQSPFSTTGYKVIGYYTSEEDVINSPRLPGSVNLRPGDLKYADIDGNGIIDNSDRVRLGYGSDPRSIYGINIDLKYKGAFLSLFFQGSGKKDFYLGDMIRGQMGGLGGVTYPFQMDYWTPDNTDALYPRLMSNHSYNGSNNYQTSEFWLIDASYFRLKSLLVGYDLKYKLLKNVGFLSTAKVILSGTNLFTISDAMDYYYDPESTGGGNNYQYPYQRVYSLTFNIGF